MRLVLYTGKGGVGKTTTAASTAVCAARRGRRTLVISADAAHSLSDVIECRIGSEPREIENNLVAVEVDTRAEMRRHWGRIRDFLVELFRYQGIDETVAEELAMLPGAEELTTLLAVEEFARSGEFEFVVVDCAPTDTTLRLLTLPDVAHGALRLLLQVQRALSAVMTPLARGFVPVPLPDSRVFADADRLIYRKLRQLRGRVLARSTSVRLVVTPERMVIDEARRAHTDLCLFDLAADAVVMNRLLPASATEEPFFQHWGGIQRERVAEVRECFAPLRVLESPLREDEVTGLAALAQHGEELFAGCEPDALLTPPQRIRYSRSGDRYQVVMPLPGAKPSDIEITKTEAELIVRAGPHRRVLYLPRRIAPLFVEHAQLRDGKLSIHFAAPGAVGRDVTSDKED